MTEGYVYVLASAAGPVKVGTSVEPKSRRAPCGRQGFGRCDLVYVSPHQSHSYTVEARAHDILSPWRVEAGTYREWFAVSPRKAKRAIMQAIQHVEAEQRQQEAWEALERARPPPAPPCPCIAFAPLTCATARLGEGVEPCGCDCHEGYRRHYG